MLILEIIFEDDIMLVVNKPISADAEKLYPNYHLVNRIDQRVSGLMVLAKDEATAAKLSLLFKNDGVIKKYKAVVGAVPVPEKADLKHWIVKDAKLKKAKAYKEKRTDGKEARLRYELAQSSEKYFLLEILLQTGRFHQIRAQLAAIGCPIVGDVKYGFKRTTKDGSIFLQAYYLSLPHPKSGKILHLNLPMPEAWAKYGFKD
jgi:23S rRNA pseudouridine1911/1915/1917 synthase